MITEEEFIREIRNEHDAIDYKDLSPELKKTLEDLTRKVSEIETLQRSISDTNNGIERKRRLGFKKDGLLYAINTIYFNFQIYHSE